MSPPEGEVGGFAWEGGDATPPELSNWAPLGPVWCGVALQPCNECQEALFIKALAILHQQQTKPA